MWTTFPHLGSFARGESSGEVSTSSCYGAISCSLERLCVGDSPRGAPVSTAPWSSICEQGHSGIMQPDVGAQLLGG